MTLKKSDYLYIVITIILAAIVAEVLVNPGTSLGIYITLGLLGIVMILAIVILPSIGASILIITIFTNISALLTNAGYPGLSKPLVAIIFIAIVVRNYYTGQIPKSLGRTERIWFFLGLYLVFMALSYFVADNKDRAYVSIEDLVKDIIIMITILLALRTQLDWKQAVWVVIITTVFLASLGVYQVVTGSYAQKFLGMASYKLDVSTYRLGGPVNDPNMWGQILVAVIPLVIFRLIHEKNSFLKLLSLGFLGILLFEVLNTYSRGAYLSLAISVVAILFFFEKKLDTRWGVLILALVVVAYTSVPSDYRERFATLTDLFPSTQNGIYQDNSLRGRSSEILTGLSMFADKPLLGVGAGNYLNNYQKYSQQIGIELRSEEREAHSLYVQVLAETGLFGILAFMGVLFSLWDALAKVKNSIQTDPAYEEWIPWLSSLQVAMLGYLIAALFLHGAYIRYFWILAALAITAMQLIDETRRNTRESLHVHRKLPN